MAKKPAPLTSDLLVRKGEARPSSIEATESGTASATPEETPAEATAAQAAAPIDTDGRPQTPEPEIVLAADEDADGDTGSRRRLASVLALVAIVTAGAFAFNMFGPDADNPSVAPVGGDADVATAEDLSVAPIIATPGPESVGTPTPPAETELRLEAAGDSATTTPATDSPPPVAPIIDETIVVETAPVTQPREAATITPQLPATPEPVAVEPAEPVAAAVVAEENIAAPVAEPGQYLIQLLSVRSESAARSAWTRLQSLHGALLEDQTLNLETADLGERGTYYRVRFGAYDERSAANAVCKSLKDAGQDCLVKRAN